MKQQKRDLVCTVVSVWKGAPRGRKAPSQLCTGSSASTAMPPQLLGTTYSLTEVRSQKKERATMVLHHAKQILKGPSINFVSARFMWLLRRDQRKSSFVLVDKTLWCFRFMKCPFEVKMKSLIRPSQTKNNLDEPLLAS